MAEPLSYLNPPEDRVHPAPVSGAGKEKLEWILVDLNAQWPGMESFLPGLWKRMHDDGTFEMFFHEGPSMGFVEFCTIILNPKEKVQLVGGYDKDGTAKEHAGLVILANISTNDKVKRAIGNFMFFKDYWNRHDTNDLGNAVLDHWFGTMDFDVIAGSTPRENHAAIRFIKRMGFQIVGDIPGFTIYKDKQSSTAISFMTREMWKARKEK